MSRRSLKQKAAKQDIVTIKRPSRNDLSVEQQREIIYSALLRYSSDALEIRDRALQSLVLAALAGSTEDSPLRLGEVRKILKFAPLSVSIRDDVLQHWIEQLIKEGKVAETKKSLRKAYYLTEKGSKEVGQAKISADDRFEKSLARMLKDTSYKLPEADAKGICRRFVLECIARSGHQIAMQVCGKSQGNIGNKVDTQASFDVAAEGIDINPPERESLRIRCEEFLESRDPENLQLMFDLTQSYYIAELLDIQGAKFVPLNHDAFSGSVFYLDTNVLITGAMSMMATNPEFAEVLECAKGLGIELRVTRGTIEETRHVAADRISKLKKISDVVPKEIIEETKDEIVTQYSEAKAAKPDLTPEEFLAPLDDISSIVRTKWKLEIEEVTERDFQDDAQFRHIAEAINSFVTNARGFGKSPAVLAHDICHYLLIARERAKCGGQCWFLTRDRLLIAASTEIVGPQEQCFCFNLLGFLHSISPFVTSSVQQSSLVDTISHIFSEQFPRTAPLIELSDLAILAENHEDLMSTPPDKILKAWDFIKTHALKGRPYRREDIPKVTLELRRYISTYKDEKLKERDEELARMRAVTEDEQTLRREAETELASQYGKITALESKVEDLTNSLRTEREARSKDEMKRSLRSALFSVFLGYPMIVFHRPLQNRLVQDFHLHLSFQNIGLLKWIILGMALLLVTVPPLSFIADTKWPRVIKHPVSVLIVIAAIIVLLMSKVVSLSSLATAGDILGIASLIGITLVEILVVFCRSNKGVSRAEHSRDGDSALHPQTNHQPSSTKH